MPTLKLTLSGHLVTKMSVAKALLDRIEEAQSQEGWCLVMANKQVTGKITATKAEAEKQQKDAPVATTIKFGKRASDGEYIATRAVDPTE